MSQKRAAPTEQAERNDDPLRIMGGGGLSSRLETLKVISIIAFRNLLASKLKTVIVGGIIFFGAVLVVVGTSLVDSVVNAMSRSIIGSVSGHIQVYSANSKDKLEVVGSFDFEGGDLEEIDDYAKMRAALHVGAQREGGGADGRVGGDRQQRQHHRRRPGRAA